MPGMRERVAGWARCNEASRVQRTLRGLLVTSPYIDQGLGLVSILPCSCQQLTQKCPAAIMPPNGKETEATIADAGDGAHSDDAPEVGCRGD